MCFALGHITAYGRFSDKRKRSLGLISYQRMYPGDPAHEILPHALVRWRKHLALFQKQGKTNSVHLFLPFLFGIWYLFLTLEAILACHRGERTVRIRKVKGLNPSVSTKQKKDHPFGWYFFVW